MLFAWADENTVLEEIVKLNIEDEIGAFFGRRKNVIVVGDQLNALTESNCEEKKQRAKLYRSLMRFTSDHIAVFSSSANYQEYLDRSKRHDSYNTLRVYNGLDRVSHHNLMS